MSWTAPMTAVAGAVFTAAQFNTFLRDNLAETAPAKATTPGSIFVTSATNQIAERIPTWAESLSSDTTVSTSYGPLSASAGPSVTVTTGSQALVLLHAQVANSGAGSSRASFNVTGVSSVAEQDNRGPATVGVAGVTVAATAATFLTGLTPGVNTFTTTYKVTSGTG
ncbi:hypothetical protein, partial [Streptomyces sp. NPDC001781]